MYVCLGSRSREIDRWTSLSAGWLAGNACLLAMFGVFVGQCRMSPPFPPPFYLLYMHDTRDSRSMGCIIVYICICMRAAVLHSLFFSFLHVCVCMYVYTQGGLRSVDVDYSDSTALNEDRSLSHERGW